ncbi:MAG: fumarate hydratase [Lentisphaeria bacterium]|nr:fumarate hydratase [Lentisphaeria bacterium]NQZ68351.1 fumarate hydratase [Lentisphaeria bacterium]
MADYSYEETFQISKDDTDYRKLSSEHVSIEKFDGKDILKIAPAALTLLAKVAFKDISFFLRKKHLEQVAKILDDSEATDNDRYVAATLLRNAAVAAKEELPSCQDTGTAIVIAKKGQQVWTGCNDAEFLCQGIFETYNERNLRYSQIAPISMFEEKNTGNNLPAQIDLYATEGDEYKFLFLAKGGGSANKTYLYQQTKSLLNEKNLELFVEEKIRSLGTAACPPYHLVFVVGGTSAESNLKSVKLASAGYYDNLPTSGSDGGRAFRDLEWEERILIMCQETGIGAQFGGKYFAHDVKVIRLPRHAASCPVGIGVSCSADRNIMGKITRDGIFLEQLETNPQQYLPEAELALKPPVDIDLNKPMAEILKELSQYPTKTRLSLTGPLIVARDNAHAKIKEMIDAGEELPDYFKDHPIYYAGPAKTPKGKASGSFGPTTANRMDPYVDEFQGLGGSMIMLAKGNRSKMVTDACAKHGGFYLGSIGGPAAILAEENILSVEIVAFEELGMEAVRKIEVVNFPAFIIVDDKGNDFFESLT